MARVARRRGLLFGPHSVEHRAFEHSRWRDAGAFRIPTLDPGGRRLGGLQSRLLPATAPINVDSSPYGKLPYARRPRRQKVLSEKSRKSRSIDPRSLEAAEYTILLTNANAETLSAHKALELYRFRWQIENVFKRFKSLLNLDHLAAREPSMVQTYVLAKILGALLVEDLTDRYLSFFPWGYPLRTTGNLALASPRLVRDTVAWVVLGLKPQALLPSTVNSSPPPNLQTATKTTERVRSPTPIRAASDFTLLRKLAPMPPPPAHPPSEPRLGRRCASPPSRVSEEQECFLTWRRSHSRDSTTHVLRGLPGSG